MKGQVGSQEEAEGAQQRKRLLPQPPGTWSVRSHLGGELKASLQALNSVFKVVPPSLGSSCLIHQYLLPHPYAAAEGSF